LRPENLESLDGRVRGEISDGRDDRIGGSGSMETRPVISLSEIGGFIDNPVKWNFTIGTMQFTESTREADTHALSRLS